jgi:ribosomal protein S17E
MGKIKSKSVRNAAKILFKEGIAFSPSFGQNKKILEGFSAGKKIRNQLAGLMTKKSGK